MATERHEVRLRLALEGLQQFDREVRQADASLDNLLRRRSPGAFNTGTMGTDPIGIAAFKAVGAADERVGPFSRSSEARAQYAAAELRLAGLKKAQAASEMRGAGAYERATAAVITQTLAVSRARRNLAETIVKEGQLARADRAQGQPLVDAINRGRRMHADALAAAAREERERTAAANTLERQRAAAYAAQLRGQEAATRSLDRQRQAAYAEELRGQQRAAASLDRQRQAALSRQVARDENALRQSDVDRMLAVPAREAGDTPLVYEKRRVLADRQLAAEGAALRLQETINASLAGTLGTENEARRRLAAAIIARDAANRSVIGAEESLAKQIRNAEIVQARNVASMRENFITGFRGRRGDVGMAEQLGQAAKFSLLYGGAYKALFLLTQTLQNTLQEGIAFQDAMTDLAIATDRPKEELSNIADQLGAFAVEAGAAPSQGMQVGARALGLYGVTESPAAEQDRVMRISSQVVSRLAVGSEMQPVELQGQIAAVAQALGLGAQGQYRIADLDAYFTKKFGIQQGATLQPVSEAATVGIAAGFSPEDLFAISADLMSRTGQTGSTVAGYMAQIFSRGGEGSLTTVASRYGIDPTQELAEIVRQLADVYRTADPNERSEIAASFGRGKIQNAAIALLNDYDEVRRRSAEARGGAATGAADQQFEQRMADIGGRLQQLGGDLQDFASLLGESGLLDAFGAGVIALDEFVEGINGVLRLFNELPRPIRDVIWGLGALALGLRVAGGRQALAEGLAGSGGVLGRVGTAYRQGRGTMLTGSAQPDFYDRATGTGMFVGGMQRVQTPGAAAAARGLAAAGSAALATVAPFGLAIGGLMAIGSLKNTADRINSAAEAADVALRSSPITSDSTAGEFQAYASELRSLAQRSRDATGWLANAVTFGAADNGPRAEAMALEEEAGRLEAIAKRIEAREAAAPGVTPPTFADFSAASLDAGLADITAAGGTAATRLDALRDALYGTADAASAAEEAFDPQAFADRIGDPFQAVLEEAFAPGGAAGTKGLSNVDRFAFDGIRDQAAFDERGLLGGVGDASQRYTSEDILRRFRDEMPPGEINERLRDAIERRGIDSEAGIDRNASVQLANDVMSGVAERALEGTGADPDVIRRYQRQINRVFARELRQQSISARRVVAGRGPLDDTAHTELLSRLATESAAALEGMADLDFGGRRAELQRYMRDIRRANSRRGGATDFSTDLMDQARRSLVQNQVDELESLRQAALRNARSRRAALRVSRANIRRQIGAVVRGGGDADQLAQVIAAGGAYAVEMARQAIEDSLKVARAALAVRNQIAAAASQQAAGLRGIVRAAAADGVIMPRGQRQSNDRIRGLEALADSLQYTPPGDTDSEIATYTGSPQGQREAERLRAAEAEKDKKDKAKEAVEEAETRGDRRAAAAAARAARRGGDLAAARASLVAARVALSQAEKGSVEWFNALAQLHEAQRAMSDAALAYRANLRMLRIDATNPLKVARAEAAAAAAQLRADIRRGQARDVIVQDRINLQAARANAEQTAFQQRLDAVTTAEELGRISHGKYISYLENERERLGRIKNRTFQQQQQLDQIDRLIKDANQSMAAQFNFGDIKLPTPYQVRRFITEQTKAAVAAPGAGVSNNTNVNIQIDGADTAKVKAIIKDVVGAGARINTTATRRR